MCCGYCPVTPPVIQRTACQFWLHFRSETWRLKGVWQTWNFTPHDNIKHISYVLSPSSQVFTWHAYICCTWTDFLFCLWTAFNLIQNTKSADTQLNACPSVLILKHILNTGKKQLLFMQRLGLRTLKSQRLTHWLCSLWITHYHNTNKMCKLTMCNEFFVIVYTTL